MAQNTIDAIREAENACIQKEKDARKQAEDLISEAKTKAEALFKERIDAVKAEGQKAFESAEADNEAVVAKAKEEAAEEIGRLREAVRSHEKDAVQQVLMALIS